MVLEILNRAFVFLRRGLAVKRAEVFPLARSRISLAGIEPILAGLQFPNHDDSLGVFLSTKIFATRSQVARVQSRASNIGCRIMEAGRPPVLQRLPQAIRNAKREKRGQNCEIGREMRRETPVLANVAETAAGNVESANFCGDCREGKGHN